MTRRAQPEHDEQVMLIKRIALHPRCRELIFTAIPNGGWRHKATAGKLKAEGVSPGVPDLLFFTPSSDRKHVGLAIEMKVKPNRPTAGQLEWLRQLASVGWQTALCYSQEEAWAVLAEYLDIPLD